VPFSNMFNNGHMSKSDDTRLKITETALASFRERGYDQTTLRLIATEAGLSVGNAYYYFPTKNHLVQELYIRVQQEHRMMAEPLLVGITDLPTRLETVLMTGLDALRPYHDSAPGFLSAAIAPTSAVSPFGPDSAEPRQLAVGLFDEVVEGSTNPMPSALKSQLPELLWLAYMALALYWVYDTSPEQEKTRRLTKRAVRLFGMVLPLTRLPFVRGPLNEFLAIAQEARI
jgi:AcrR family transcriptional regulator